MVGEEQRIEMIDEQPGLQQPATGDRPAWHAFWSERGQPWRQEPL